MKKQPAFSLHGFLEIQTVIILVLLVVFFVVTVAIIKPLFSSDFQMSWRERWCQITVVLNRYIHATDKFSFPLACSTERLIVTEKEFKKAMTADDKTITEGGARYILDTMRRCKFLVGGENKIALTRSKHCYICYTLEMSGDIPLLPVQSITLFSYLKKTEKGESYAVDLQSSGLSDYPHIPLLLTETIKPNIDYAVVYVDYAKPAKWIEETKGFGSVLGGCIIGGKIGGLVGSVVPVAGTIVGAVKGCLIGGSVGEVTAVASILYDAAGSQTNKILLTDLHNLGDYGSSECEGYAY